jgi:hypothetical protein
MLALLMIPKSRQITEKQGANHPPNQPRINVSIHQLLREAGHRPRRSTPADPRGQTPSGGVFFAGSRVGFGAGKPGRTGETERCTGRHTPTRAQCTATVAKLPPGGLPRGPPGANPSRLPAPPVTATPRGKITGGNPAGSRPDRHRSGGGRGDRPGGGGGRGSTVVCGGFGGLN